MSGLGSVQAGGDAALAGRCAGGMATEAATEIAPADEHRIERLAWFGLVGVLVLTGSLRDWLAPHNGITPLAAGLILLLSGTLQWRRGLRARYTNWLAGALLLGMAAFSFLGRPELDMFLPVVIIAIIVIGRGTFARGS